MQGPVGLAAAIECKRHELNYIVLEKGILTNSLFHFPTDMRFFTTAALLEIGNPPFPSTALKPDRMMALDYYRRVTELEELNVKLQHEVILLNKKNDKFVLQVEETYLSKITKLQYEARFVVIATGYYDNPN